MAFFLLLSEHLWTVTWSTYMFVFIFLPDMVACIYDAIRDRHKNIIKYVILKRKRGERGGTENVCYWDRVRGNPGTIYSLDAR
jgi:hypothetical protein